MPEQRDHKRKIVVAFVVVLLLAIFVPPFVNANLFRARLARSVSNALGRNVTMGDVNIRLLPLPGFQIQNFVIMDDPAFSAEPMLRAESVTARLRLTSLWRGRLEIARLSFAYPSLNLVRNAEGRWNIQGVLAHASQVAAAPTGKKQPESRLRFPYIEADSGRINFKVLQEKKAHALVEADFALWQEAENQWNMRLEARPTRTDDNLGDTGTLRIEGSFQRADTIESTPMKLNFDWEKAQLGQLTELVYGRDRGWRGDVRVSGVIDGMPRQFTTKVSAEVADFHRYDISGDDPVNVKADCTAGHSTIPAPNQLSFRNSLECAIPISDGSVVVKAFGQYWAQTPSYFSIRANAIPVAVLTRIYRHAKRDVPRDLTGVGILNAYFSRVNYPQDGRWIGQGTLTNVHVSSATLAEDFKVDSVHFGFTQIEQSPEGPASAGLSMRINQKKTSRLTAAMTTNVFTVDPFSAELGGATPVVIAGANTAAGLQLQVKGDANIKRLSSAAELFGLQLPLAQQTTGLANVDYSITGHWSGFAAPVVTGTTRAAARPASPQPTESASNQQHAKTAKPSRQ